MRGFLQLDTRVQQLLDFIVKKFGLSTYELTEYHMKQEVNLFHETSYYLYTEWLPKSIKGQNNDEEPAGAATIVIDIHSLLVRTFIFHKGVSYAVDGVQLKSTDLSAVTSWIEQETGKLYQEDFYLYKQNDREYSFRAGVDGIPVSPGCSIDIALDEQGHITLFLLNGTFPKSDSVKRDEYRLSGNILEDSIQKQLQLIELPILKEKKARYVYAIEEIFVSNDGTSSIPIMMNQKPLVKINKAIEWDSSGKQDFKRKEIDWGRDDTVSADVAFANEQSPLIEPITTEELQRGIQAVKSVLQHEFPQESGKWNLESYYREHDYLIAVVRAEKQPRKMLQRKLTIAIDKITFEPLDFMDNQFFVNSMNNLPVENSLSLTKEVAYEVIRDEVEVTPVYAFQMETQQYILCGKIDCSFAVDAETGQLLSLDEML